MTCADGSCESCVHSIGDKLIVDLRCVAAIAKDGTVIFVHMKSGHVIRLQYEATFTVNMDFETAQKAFTEVVDAAVQP